MGERRSLKQRPPPPATRPRDAAVAVAEGGAMMASAVYDNDVERGAAPRTGTLAAAATAEGTLERGERESQVRMVAAPNDPSPLRSARQNVS